LVIAIARGRPGAPPDEILPQQAPGHSPPSAPRLRR
jgi:hypothetical protein